MSITNRHSVQPFVSGKSAPFHGQRLSKVGYKSTEKNKAKLPSVFVSVPFLANETIIPYSERLLPHVKALLEDAQDKIVKGLYESSEGNLSSVSDEEISMESILAYLDSESSGGRLTKEMIQNWFKGEIEDNLTVYIAEKLGFNDPSEGQLVEVSKHVNGYREVFSSLAGGATVLNTAQIQGCKRALAVAGNEGDVSGKLLKRLEGMEKPVMVKELLDL